MSLDRIYNSLCQSNSTSEGNKEICISKLCITTSRLFILYLWGVYFEVFIRQYAETWESFACNHVQVSNLLNAYWAGYFIYACSVKLRKKNKLCVLLVSKQSCNNNDEKQGAFKTWELIVMWNIYKSDFCFSTGKQLERWLVTSTRYQNKRSEKCPIKQKEICVKWSEIPLPVQWWWVYQRSAVLSSPTEF